jgi:hypothetical protein
MRRKRLLLLGVGVLLLAAGALAFAAVGNGSEPASQDVTVPAAGSSTSVQWTGTIPANANPTSDCSQATGTVANDSHGITVHVPTTGYTGLKTTFSFSISWTPANPTGAEDVNDEILTVVSDNGDEADQSGTREIQHDGNGRRDEPRAGRLHGAGVRLRQLGAAAVHRDADRQLGHADEHDRGVEQRPGPGVLGGGTGRSAT